MAPKCLLRSLVIRKEWYNFERALEAKESGRIKRGGNMGRVIMVGYINT